MSKRKRTTTLPHARHTGATRTYVRHEPEAVAAEPPAPPEPQSIGWSQQDTLILLAGILLVIVVYAWRLDKPERFVFDEVYHAYTAGQLEAGNADAYFFTTAAPEAGVAYEWTHPAMSKLIMEASIRIFGNDSVGWRAASTLFGALGVGLIFVMGRLMFNRTVGIFAMVLLALDGLWFTQSRIGMNDVFLTFFIMAAFLSFYMYLRGPAPETRQYLLLTGLAFGFAIATKWSAGYSFALVAGIAFLREAKLYYVDRKQMGAEDILLRLAILLISGMVSAFIGGRIDVWIPFSALIGMTIAGAAIVLVDTLAERLPADRWWLSKAALAFAAAFLVLPPVVYLVAYTQFFNMGYSLRDFADLQKQMYWYHTGLKATHTYASSWWEWPLLLKPVWYYVEDVPNEPNKISNIFGMGNPLIFWAFLPAIGFVMWDWLESRDWSASVSRPWQWLSGRTPQVGLALVLLGFFGQWLPWALSPRISFHYHMLPAVPFGCLAIAWCLDRLRAPRLVTVAYLVPVLLAFIYFYPMYSGYPITREYAEQHYWLDDWKPH